MQASRRLFGALGVIGMIAVGMPTPSEAKITLTYATYISEVYTTTKADIWFMDEIEKRSNGEIVFERYFSGSLLKAPDLFPGLARGAADVVSGAPSAYNRNDYPLSNVTLPFITEHADAVTKAFGQLFETNANLRKEYEGRNAKLLYARGYAENTIWSQKPIEKAADYKGLKVRAVLAIGDVLNKLGATTVAVPYPEAVEGMGRGVIDAMSSSPFDSGISSGLHEIAKFGSDGGRMGVYAASQVAINLKRWNSLSDAHKKLFMQVSAETIDYYTKMHAEEVAKAAEKLCATSNHAKIHVFTDAEVQEIRAIAEKPVHDAWVKWASDATGINARELLDEYTSLVRKYEAESNYTPGFQVYSQKCGNS